jgi:hypothetical protein
MWLESVTDNRVLDSSIAEKAGSEVSQSRRDLGHPPTRAVAEFGWAYTLGRPVPPRLWSGAIATP